MQAAARTHPMTCPLLRKRNLTMTLAVRLAVRGQQLTLRPPSSQIPAQPDSISQVLLTLQSPCLQIVKNLLQILLFLLVLTLASTWTPHLRFLGRIWHRCKAGSQTKLWAEVATEGVAWVMLVKMLWPW